MTPLVSSPRVSVIVPVYNGAAYLSHALQSALAQTFTACEVIVVDDGSTDDSGRIAEAFAARAPTQVRVIHQANGGLCAARNAALAVARGEFLALLDADDLWLPHHLSASVAALDAHADVGLVHANIDWVDEAGTPVRRLEGRWPASIADPWLAVFLRQQHVSCPTAVFRRSLVERVGDFDMQFNRLGCEDRDLWLRIGAVSNMAYLDTVHAHYRLHAGSLSQHRERMTQARLALIEKHSLHGSGRRFRREAISAVRADQGDEFKGDGRRADALRAYGAALQVYPWWGRPWKSVVKTVLNRG